MIQFQVDQFSAAVAEMAEHWCMIAALSGGTHEMREAGKRFLPAWPAEDDASYKTRLATATLFPAFARTASVMAAKPFVRPLNWKSDPPARVAELFDDIDLLGSDLQGYAYSLMGQCLSFGLVGVLVDYPTVEGVRTLADEKQAGVRPYFATYPATSILGWRTARGPNGMALAQLRLKECVTEPDGPWGERQIEQVRVLYPGRWEIWRKNDKAEWFLYDQGATTLDKIPFVFFYGCKTGFGTAQPPLLNLAHLNVEHWQSASDQQTILHVARVPILFAKGFTETDTLTVGAGAAVQSLSEGAELSYVEHSGAAIEAGRTSLLDLEDRMRQAGAELLVQRAAVATATQVASESESSRSVLQQIVEDFEDSLEAAVGLLGDWLGEPFDPEIELYKDFGAAGLSEKTGDFLLRAAAQGLVSGESAFRQLQRIDVIDPNLDWEEEQQRIEDHHATALDRKVTETKAMAAANPPEKPSFGR